MFSLYESLGKAANKITAAMMGTNELMRSHKNAESQKLEMCTPLTN